jgi:hypothetical protein
MTQNKQQAQGIESCLGDGQIRAHQSGHHAKQEKHDDDIWQGMGSKEFAAILQELHSLGLDPGSTNCRVLDAGSSPA